MNATFAHCYAFLFSTKRTMPRAFSTYFSYMGSEFPLRIFRMKYFSKAIFARCRSAPPPGQYLPPHLFPVCGKSQLPQPSCAASNSCRCHNGPSLCSIRSPKSAFLGCRICLPVGPLQGSHGAYPWLGPALSCLPPRRSSCKCCNDSTFRSTRKP